MTRMKKAPAGGHGATNRTRSSYPSRCCLSNPFSADPFDRLAEAFVLALADAPGPVRADVLRRRVRAMLQEAS